MRKEVKLGLAIGGVFLAVLVVWILAVGGSSRPVQQSGGNSSGVANASGEGAITPTLEPAPTVAATPTTAPSEATASAASSGPDWGKLLNAEEAMPMIAHTPSAAPAPALAEKTSPTPSPAPPAAPSVASAALVDPAPTPLTPAPVIETPAPVVQPTAAPATQPAPAPVIASTPVATSARTHVIQRGETLSSISIAAYGSPNYYPHILRANPKLDANRMRPGTTIVLPDIAPSHDLPGGAVAAPAAHVSSPVSSTSEYRVTAGDSLYRISVKLYGKGEMQDKLYELNKAAIGADPAKLKLGMVLKLPEPPTVRAD